MHFKCIERFYVFSNVHLKTLFLLCVLHLEFAVIEDYEVMFEPKIKILKKMNINYEYINNGLYR